MNYQEKQAFNKALTAWQDRDYTRVLNLLEKAKNAQALHLRGIAARRAGRLNMSKTSLERALRLDTSNPEINHNLALLQIDRGEHDLALELSKQALTLKPDWPNALRTQGRILIALGRWPEALHVYDKILDKNPDDTAACYGRANVWLEQGRAEDAAAEFDRLINSGMTDPACLFMRGRARQTLGQMKYARADFEQAMQLQPRSMYLREAARHLWTMNEHDAFQELVSKPYTDEALQVCAGDLLRQSGNFKQLVNTFSNPDQSPDALAILAWSALDQSQPNEALDFSQRAVQLNSNHANARAAVISSLCALGEATQAQQHIDHMRALEPHGQHWIAYQLAVWRLLDDERYKAWMDYQQLVQSYELSTPDGYNSIEAFNAEFESALLELHNHRCHPLDQSLRGGSQTRRDLQLEQHPVIQAYLTALEKPIQDYLEHIGRNPEHPLSARNTGRYKLAGCWSVKLDGGGHHINHVHPEGWISSAYYVKVPPSNGDEKSGWIKFGEPAYPTEPPSAAEYSVEARAGRLVSFPSYLWHGTYPTSGTGLRLTAPFDIVPD